MPWNHLVATEIQRLFAGLNEGPASAAVNWKSSHIEYRPARFQQEVNYSIPFTNDPVLPLFEEKEKTMNTDDDYKTLALKAFLDELSHYRGILQNLGRVAGLSIEGGELPPTPTEKTKRYRPPVKHYGRRRPQPKVVGVVIEVIAQKLGVNVSRLIEREQGPQHIDRTQARQLAYYLSYHLGHVPLENLAYFFDRPEALIEQQIERFTEDLQEDSDLQRLTAECTAMVRARRQDEDSLTPVGRWMAEAAE